MALPGHPGCPRHQPRPHMSPIRRCRLDAREGRYAGLLDLVAGPPNDTNARLQCHGRQLPSPMRPAETIRSPAVTQWRGMGDFDLVTAKDVMQGLAQRVTAVRPDLVNSDATFGKLAWIWG